MDLSAFNVIAIISIAFLALMLFLALFEPGLRYKIRATPSVPPDSEDFVRMLGALADAQVHSHNRIEVLTNGEVFYEAELEAIRRARHSINVEAYIFQKGEVSRRFVEALTERAAAGVRVNIVLDAIGSFATWGSYVKELRDAGARVEWYHPIKWYTLPRINNRTHRELIIIDGEVGFIGGAGIADHWLRDKNKRRRWRDTMFRVEGKAVTNLQSTFAENWLEASGEILMGKGYFPLCEVDNALEAMVVNSSPSAGASTRARILFQTLLASATRSIYITTPYFLPDKSAREEMIRAIKERGVEVKIVTPGKHSDHLLTRTSSRRLYGDLLKAGAHIYEYKPAMIHAKVMIVDGLWSVVGSTNFDNRSFGLNDEVNLAGFDARLAERLQEDFARDVAESHAVTYDEWKRRSIFERAHEWLGWVLERQQ
ncbi:MAG TPA: phospholipase D-like domain-containing protein [Blastocatellia bacterium]|jgi:cardiolipin synthase|nr:phospholipase D-like domain-containing protein [Blastocatellia bacterium]